MGVVGSAARGYGDGCWAKIREVQRAADLSAWTSSQVEEAREAIEDGAVVPSIREGVFHVVSVDGTETHLVHRDGCNCIHGLKTSQARPFWHRAAVAIVLSVTTPAPRPVLVPAAVATAPADFWAEMDRLADAFMAVA